MGRWARALFLLLVFVSTPKSFAVRRVIFFHHHSNESTDRFYHVAIQVGKQWLSAEPYGGVQLRAELDLSHHPMTVLVDHEAPDLTRSQIAKWIGLPFDHDFDWATNDRIYCAELVAKILKLTPTKMSFSSPHWPARLRDRNGAVGSSPDKIYKALIDAGYRVESTTACESAVTEDIESLVH